MGTMDFKPLRYFNADKSHRRRYHVATSSAGEREAAAAAGRSSDQPRIEERRRSVDIGTGNIEGSKENILPSGRHLTNPYILNVTNFFPAIPCYFIPSKIRWIFNGKKCFFTAVYVSLYM